MKIILLSGGSGKRLWPLSNDVRSKQFLKLLSNEKGDPESMVQRVCGQIKKAGIEADIVVATGKKQAESIYNQLGKTADVVLEPVRRDTFPAIMLATSYLYYMKEMNADEVVIVLPVDPYAEMNYFKLLKDIVKKVEAGVANIALMGIKPTYPSAKYGYIIPDKENKFVKRFQEKPTEELAKKLIEKNALWNGGVFAFRVGYVIDILKKYIDFSSYEEVELQYESLPKISFDYEVIEKEESITFAEYKGVWKDLGTWNTLTEVMKNQTVGKVITDEHCNNTHVINELDIPITVLGSTDMVVVASPDGILVSDKHKSSYLKEYIGGLTDRPMVEEHRWGEYKVIDYVHYSDGSSSLTKSLIIQAGEYLNYEEHATRDEVMTIVDGLGELVLDGQVQKINRGDVLCIQKGQKHAVRAITDMRIIEVGIGHSIVEEDAKQVEWIWK